MRNFECCPLDKTDDGASSALYKQIVRHIRNWIREGKIKEGETLPSERELTRIFDVSRVPVREALKTLEYIGIVEQVRGKGVFVKRVSMDHVLDKVDFVMDEPIHAVIELFEVREGFEIQAVKLAAQRRTEEDLDDMEMILLETKRNIRMEKGIEALSVKFHSALIRATHNEIFIKIYAFLSNYLNYSRQHSQKDTVRRKEVLAYHTKIWEQIRDRDVDGAVSAMAGHLDAAKKIVEAAASGKGREEDGGRI